jgi:predicted AAA+ superfamily ATPase
MRYLKQFLLEDILSKIIMISGPRQSGKTTLSKSLIENALYFNYDFYQDREKLIHLHWPRDASALIFDEIHKMDKWKQWLKGYYDRYGIPPSIVVTGSAQLDSFSHAGDSLAGRYFHFRLHPIDIKEAVMYFHKTPQQAYDLIMMVGGFPEPFFRESERFYLKWQRTHLDIVLRQDLLDIYAVRSILKIETLTELLKKRVGSPISYRNLAQDLQVDSKTIMQWCMYLEQFYLVFKITPFHHNIVRSLLKEPKYYFFDVPRVEDIGARLENLVACSLLKEVQFVQDTQGLNVSLHYLRTKDGVEVDFALVFKEKVLAIFEVKHSDATLSKSLKDFHQKINPKYTYQLVANLDKNDEYDTQEGIKIRDLVDFLAHFDLMSLI